MAGGTGAPHPQQAETPYVVGPSTSSSLTVDDSQRQTRKDLPSYEVTAKSGQWSNEYLRHLSPSPAPNGRRLSSDPAGPMNTTATTAAAAAAAVEDYLYQPPKEKMLQRFWRKNKGAVLVAVSQFFGALMNLSARLLEFEGDGMHPVQVLLLRQVMTSICCFVYMWWKSTPGAPFGGRDIQLLLLIRGVAGFFGIFGMWYSMMYLPLADSTVITFLAPGIAGLLCYFFLKEPFTRIEQLATVVALLGVVFIAQPASFFSSSTTPSNEDASASEPPEHQGLPGFDHESTSEERLIAVGVSLLGVCGASVAFTTMRMIGKRAHPLISVNFFGVTCVVISGAVLILAPLFDFSQPGLSWAWPPSVKAWCLLLLLGILGFTMQYLLTAGLQADKSNKANSMVYTHMLFAASFDRWVFHHEMNLMSFFGCALILGSAISVVVLRKPPAPKVDDVERQHPYQHQPQWNNMIGEGERSPMLVGVGGNTEDLPLSRL